MRAFDELGTTRQIGMGLGPIPWHRILQYAGHAGLDGDMTRVFKAVMRAMDGVYLDWQAERAKRTGGDG